jgi:hypothetical protein
LTGGWCAAQRCAKDWQEIAMPNMFGFSRRRMKIGRYSFNCAK